MRRPIIAGLGFVLLVACTSKRPWDVAGAPTVPPDLQYRTGVEVGSDEYVWYCYRGERVVVSQSSSAFCGASPPRLLKQGACGRRPEDDEADRSSDVPDGLRWPGSPPPAPRPIPDAATNAPASDAAPHAAHDAG